MVQPARLFFSVGLVAGAVSNVLGIGRRDHLRSLLDPVALRARRDLHRRVER
jgi:hypothetical protein